MHYAKYFCSLIARASPRPLLPSLRIFFKFIKYQFFSKHNNGTSSNRLFYYSCINSLCYVLVYKYDVL